jgi:hypothetical protein
MGLYNDGEGNLFWGPLQQPSDSSGFDRFMQNLTGGVVALSVAIGAGAAVGAAAGVEGLATVSAGEVGAGTVGVDASTGLFAGEASAEIGTVGVDASTGLFAGEAATLAPEGVELGGAMMPAADASAIAETTAGAGSLVEEAGNPFLDQLKAFGQKAAGVLASKALQKKPAAPAPLTLRPPTQTPLLTPGGGGAEAAPQQAGYVLGALALGVVALFFAMR